MDRKITVRFNDEYAEKIEELKEKLSKQSIVGELTDSDVIRFAIKKLHDRVMAD